jgi:hypothetical protein
LLLPRLPVGSALLEDFAQSVLQRTTKATRLIRSKVQQQQDEETISEARAMERWLDDGGALGQMPV